MKTLLTVVCSFCVATLGSAQSAPAEPAPSAYKTEAAPAQTKEPAPDEKPKPELPPLPKPVGPPVRITPPKAGTDKDTTKKADATKKAQPEKKEEPKITGIVVSRGDKGFIGVEIVGGGFKITFYDTKKKKIAPDVARAALRWDAKYKVGSERVVLNPDADGKSLSNPKTIRPPYAFKLYITLVKVATESEEPVGETHVIDFRA